MDNSPKWIEIINDYKIYLKLERSLSPNSVEAYIHDIEKLLTYLEIHKLSVLPENIQLSHLKDFIEWINELNMSARSQGRMISGLKSFYKFLLMEEKIETDPTELLETPKIGRKLPDTLSVEEIDEILSAIDLSKPEGQRNKAIIETLYSCGLRVTELTSLKISNLYLNDKFIRVIGKGNKERLVPISNKALKEIQMYRDHSRTHISVKKGNEDILFLNRRGNALTRVMIFTIIKELVEKIGMKKNISPHTFRHSFASHLIDGGADLRAVQEMLGHESIITTEIYTHLDREYLRDAIIRFHPRA